ncbi:hypothetical protein BJX76DRAFT_356282 [Aspergillus varians]
MAAPLPAPIPNYAAMNAFIGAFDEITRPSFEDRVTAMWSFILGQAFPGAEDYVLHPQYSNSAGFTDITMHHWRRAPAGNMQRTPFLIAQMKRTGCEGSLASWHEAEHQLNRYLGRLAPTPRYRHLYGIVAIGRWVKFYKYNKTWRHVAFMQGREGPYHVINDEAVIIQRLTVMKGIH